MSIKSMDMQTLIPKTTEVGRAQQIQNHRAQVGQEQFQAQFRDLMANRQQQVPDSPKPEKGRVAAENQRGRQDSGTGKREKRESRKDGPITEEGKGRVLDIKC